MGRAVMPAHEAHAKCIALCKLYCSRSFCCCSWLSSPRACDGVHNRGVHLSFEKSSDQCAVFDRTLRFFVA